MSARGPGCRLESECRGRISPVTGRVQNANSVWLNNRPFPADIEAELGCPVRLANDANCLALSEAADGAGADARSVFGIILGTGCGGGYAVHSRLADGPNRCAGEWGHLPLPWPETEEYPGPACWCGRHGCLETWLSGLGLERDHALHTGEARSAEEIPSRAAAGNHAARSSLDRHLSRLARGLAIIVDVLDPEVIVIGGGLSRMPHLYRRLPDAAARHIFAAHPIIKVRQPRFGDASGVRGAARLWEV